MTGFITFVLSNFTLSFFILGLLFTAFALRKKQNHQSFSHIIHTIFRYFILFNIGFSYFYNFIMHVFFGQMAAAFIGWTQSPFQLEVGFASLGFAIVGLIAFRAHSTGFKAACVTAPAFFLWGAAGGHIYQMITQHNFAPGNAGIIFWTDVFLPVISFCLLWLSYKKPVQK